MLLKYSSELDRATVIAVMVEIEAFAHKWPGVVTNEEVGIRALCQSFGISDAWERLRGILTA